MTNPQSHRGWGRQAMSMFFFDLSHFVMSHITPASVGSCHVTSYVAFNLSSVCHITCHICHVRCYFIHFHFSWALCSFHNIFYSMWRHAEIVKDMEEKECWDKSVGTGHVTWYLSFWISGFWCYLFVYTTQHVGSLWLAPLSHHNFFYMSLLTLGNIIKY